MKYNHWKYLPGICLVAGMLLAAMPLPAQEPSLSDHEKKYLSNLRQVTEGFEKAGEGYFSPDGKTIIYQAIRSEYPFYQIYTQPLAGGKPKLVSTGRGRTTCAYFAPDGKSIIFASSHTDPQLKQTEAEAIRQAEEDAKSGNRRRYSWPFDPHMDIYHANPDGSNLERLTTADGYDAEGAYSADGKLIAYCSMADGDPDIYLMNADGSNIRQLTDAPGYDGGPFISPNQKWVVFRSDRKEEHMLQIHVVSIDGQHDIPLTANVGVNWGPYWHPTEPYLIWAGADHSQPGARPNYDLWMARYREDGQQGFTIDEPIRITDSPAADVLPVFSPDGKQLMWTSTRTANHTSQLYIADFQLPKDEE
jgi:TolB protein